MMVQSYVFAHVFLLVGTEAHHSDEPESNGSAPVHRLQG